MVSVGCDVHIHCSVGYCLATKTLKAYNDLKLKW